MRQSFNYGLCQYYICFNRISLSFLKYISVLSNNIKCFFFKWSTKVSTITMMLTMFVIVTIQKHVNHFSPNLYNCHTIVMPQSLLTPHNCFHYHHCHHHHCCHHHYHHRHHHHITTNATSTHYRYHLCVTFVTLSCACHISSSPLPP